MTKNEMENLADDLEPYLKAYSENRITCLEIAEFIATIIKKEKSELLKDAIKLARVYASGQTECHTKADEFLAKYQKEKP